MSTIMETWSHTEHSTQLIGCEFTAAEGEGSWDLLFRVLEAVCSAQSVLEGLSGRASVVQLRDPQQPAEIWPVGSLPHDLVALRDHVAAARSANEEWAPTEIVLRAEVDLLLPTDVTAVEVADWYYDDERANRAALAITPAADREGIPAGYRRWKVTPDPVAAEEESPVYLQVDCAFDEQPPRLSMTVQSKLELWRLIPFDHDGTVPGGRHNLRWLRRAIDAVTVVARGTVSWCDEIRKEAKEAEVELS